jgi:hypothetical protein
MDAARDAALFRDLLGLAGPMPETTRTHTFPIGAFRAYLNATAYELDLAGIAVPPLHIYVEHAGGWPAALVGARAAVVLDDAVRRAVDVARKDQ